MKNDGKLLLAVTAAVALLCFGFVANMNVYLIDAGLVLAVISGFAGFGYMFSVMRGNNHCYNVFFDYQRENGLFDRVCGIIDDFYEITYDPTTTFANDKRFLHAVESINDAGRKTASETGKKWIDLDATTIYANISNEDKLKDHNLVLLKFKKTVEFRDGKDQFDMMVLFMRKIALPLEFPRSKVSDEGEIYGIGRWTVLASSGGIEEISRINATTPICRVLYSRADLKASKQYLDSKYDPNNATIKVGIAYNQDLLSAQKTGEAKLIAQDEECKATEERWCNEVQKNKMLSGGAAGSIAQVNTPIVEEKQYNWKYVVGILIGAVLAGLMML